jgi:hypothetical protein
MEQLRSRRLRTDMWLVLWLVIGCRFQSFQLQKGHPRSIPVASSRRTPVHAWVALPVRAHWLERSNILSVDLANLCGCRCHRATFAEKYRRPLPLRTRPNCSPGKCAPVTSASEPSSSRHSASRVLAASCGSTSDIA